MTTNPVVLRGILTLLQKSERELAEKAGISAPHLSKILTRGIARVEPATRQRLADGLRQLVQPGNVI